ncbi:hypothetical protein GA0115233_103082 [Streptomyces sp. DI166]|nr:hypothetical protein GA0115233_103082 [Streptomyces sp. DI166]
MVEGGALGAAEVVRPAGAELAGVRPALAPPLDGTGLAASLVRPVGLAEVPLSAAEFVASGVAVSSGTSVTSPVGPAVGRAVVPGAPTAV